MATPIPYEGAGQVQPEMRPVEPERIDAVPAAFGVNIGESISRLGQVTEGAGDEIFGRAVALQQTKQADDALAASANYSTQLGDKYNQFAILQGKDAVDALPQFQKDINDLRTSARGQLTSPYAQLLFDQDSRNLQARMEILAGGHAAEQGKVYSNQASSARVASSVNLAYTVPQSDDVFQHNIDTGINEIQTQNSGADPAVVSNKVSEFKSQMWAARITGLARSNPAGAKAMLDNAVKNDELYGTDIPSTTDFVHRQLYNAGSRHAADEIFAGNGNQFGVGKLDSSRFLPALRQIESSGNYNTMVTVTHKDGTKDIALGGYGILQSNLPSWLKEAGMASMSTKEFMQDHAAQDQLAAFEFNKYQEQGGSANAAARAWLTGRFDAGPNVKDKFGTNSDSYVTKFNAALAHGASEADLMKIARAKGDAIAPDDPTVGDYYEKRVSQQYNLNAMVQEHDERLNSLTFESAILKQNEQGHFPTSPEDLFTSDPSTKDIWDRLGQADQNKYMKQFIENSKPNRAPTDADWRLYQGMMGLAYSDPRRFAQQDIISMSMPNDLKWKLVSEQLRLFKGGQADPNMTHALQVLGPTMFDAEISKTNDPEAYNQFIGSLHDTISTWTASNGAPPKDKDILTIGSRLIQEQAYGGVNIFGHNFLQSKSPLFQMDVPAKDSAAITESIRNRTGVTPTDNEIRRVYVASKYQTLYGKQ